jgi:adenylate cyclase
MCVHRKLTAIVSVDIVGYTRLIDLEEASTHVRVRALLDGFVKKLIDEHSGKVVKATGDGVLVTFDSVVDAVECSVALQQKLANRPDDAPSDRRLRLRIGVNLGDIILDQNDVHGQGVNIAVRLQEVAQPAAVYVSRAVVEQARARAAARFQRVGEVRLKNISEPVEIFSALPGTPGRELTLATRAGLLSKRNLIAGSTAMLAVAAIAAGLILHIQVGGQSQLPALRAMAPPPPEPNSIAVIPFMNLSGDARYDLFVDGIFDDLLTDLSKLNDAVVMARNSVEAYKGLDIAPLAVAEDLAVRYVLEGSVRRVEDTLRINVRLIDSADRRNVWAQRYSGALDEMFEVQDRMVEGIMSALAIKVSEQERARILTRETENVEAYEAFRRGWAELERKTPDSLAVALTEFQKAIEIDPGYSRAHAGIGQVYWNAWVWGWESYVGETWETVPGIVERHLQKALEKPTATAYQLASDVNLYARRFDDSFEFALRAIEFAPNDPNSHVVMAEALIYGGRPAGAIPWIEAANRLDRNAANEPPPYNTWVLGMAYFGQEMFGQAIDLFEEALEKNPDDFGPAAPLAAAHWHFAQAAEKNGKGAEGEGLAGVHLEKAQAALATYYNGWPEANIEEFTVYWPFRDKADEERLAGPLRALAMPEAPE